MTGKEREARRFQINPGPLTIIKGTGRPPKEDLMTGLCQWITAKGTRCSREAQWERDYCWQHPGFIPKPRHEVHAR